MAKLYFRHGVVSSAKTLNLLACAHSYELQGKRILVLKPAMDKRFGHGTVKSRAGLDRQADILVDGPMTFEEGIFVGVDCVLVDEAQFMDPVVIEQFRHIATTQNVPVMCYGLRTDFRSRLFPGSQRLMELADVIEEVKTTCSFCNRRGTLNLKSVDGKPTLEGPTVVLGCEELYVPVCYSHYVEKIEAASGERIDFPRSLVAGKIADQEQAKRNASTDAAVPEKEDVVKTTEIGIGGVDCKSLPTVARGGYPVAEPDSEATPEKIRKVSQAVP